MKKSLEEKLFFWKFSHFGPLSALVENESVLVDAERVTQDCLQQDLFHFPKLGAYATYLIMDISIG